jgi:PAS domain S-box-containing protein
MKSTAMSASEHLDPSEAKFRSYIEHSPDGVFVTDERGRFVEVNPAVTEITGYPGAELLESSFLDLFWKDSTHPFTDYLATINARGAYCCESPFQRKDGTTRWWSVDTVRLPDRRYLFFVKDITERKNIELELVKIKELFQLFMKHSPIYCFIKEVTPFASRALYSSENYEAMIGIKGSDMVGKTMDELFPTDFAKKMTEDDWAVVSKGQVLKLDEDFKGRNYTTIKAPLTQGDRSLLMGYTIDITEQKRAEEERTSLEAQLAQAQKMESVGRLAGGVAHDFNNMLGVILGHAEMALLKLNHEHALYSHLEEIRKATERSANLTRQLLAFARRQTITPKVLDLNETIGGMLRMLERLIGEDIKLVWVPGSELWPVRVDPSQVDQILANLCVNSRDAIAGVGKITIQTDNVTFDRPYCAPRADMVPGDYVRLAVSDDGCGMDNETLSHIFEPFFTTKRVGEGTGLGLATVYGVVKQNGGFVHVDSELGHGATLEIYLPRHEDKVCHTPAVAAATPSVAGHETILLVEDEPAILSVTMSMLESQGYTVLAASSPGEAIQLAREHAGGIHLLVTDVVMPEMNGRDLAKNLMAFYPDLKRLFMSGYAADVIAHHGVLEPGTHFVPKPFSTKDLTAKVREALENC